MTYVISGRWSLTLSDTVNAEETPCRRKERRFKTTEGQVLRCDCVVDDNEPAGGSVVDISPSGLRILTHGVFKVGQEFSTELQTDRSHGTYHGVIRRVVPWVGGQTILGCQLLKKIPEDVLQTLANEGIVNRRRDKRVDWIQPACMTWELEQREVEIEIKDCSRGGMQVLSPQVIPDDVRVRIHVDTGEEALTVISARAAWQRKVDDGYMAGLAFINRQVPEAITKILAIHEAESAGFNPAAPSRFRRGLLVAAVLVTVGIASLEFSMNADAQESLIVILSKLKEACGQLGWMHSR